ncbi:translation initiation factor 5 [Guillardia theta CCMP2712]|uniref:Translation initiation factor 5 n=1 Tax=Guillardia theta (strain CCMP2712) TaxID=905079 RepID=L1IKT6_GUITC|nr:translation initiation factor 5 [Guillardia theta CCMP2712]EKX36858.1 translation initiation factor 5 [Guillardia theta CCMP2712]|eukprot:XP_005823838.1 translation initiation factor 5 [Guillardia theta CCMP2712]
MSRECKRVNMNGSQDPYYRYTMPCIQVKVEGTTKMIKSVLINIEDVCRAIGRPPDYLLTFLGQELSANSKIEKDTGKAYVSGSFEERKVQELVFKFIRETVTCQNCKNPETTCNIEGNKKNKILFLTCKGCGGRTDLDHTDRFVKYMILHPPDDANYGHAKSAAGAVGAALSEATALDEAQKKKKKSKSAEEDDEKAEKKKKKKKDKEKDSEDEGDDDEDKKEKKKKKKKDKDADDEDSPTGEEEEGQEEGGR